MSPLDDEPLLATEDIQGNILPGFDTAFLAMVFAELGEIAEYGGWLAALEPTSMANLLESGHRPPFVNVAFSYEGLTKVRADAHLVTDMPFKQGLARRSTLLGDPLSDTMEGHCSNWVVGRPDQSGLDIVFLIGYDRPDQFDVEAFTRGLPAGLRVTAILDGATNRPPRHKYEPFGFRDDISQPGLRGRYPTSGEPQPITVRENPMNANQGKPGQHLVWPGEFIFGYHGQDPLDNVRRGPLVTGGPGWAANGSLLVFRRLRQNVDGFKHFLEVASGELRLQHPGLSSLTPEQLGAKLMGRWPNGTPVVASPDLDLLSPEGDPEVENDFRFAAPSPGRTSFREASGDPGGLLCPPAAHIRRAYLRGAATSSLTEANIETHRLLRRSIAFGPESSTETGIFFLAYQTSIERQFEHVTRAWLNNPHLHNADDGQDPIAGQRIGGNGDRSRVFTIPVEQSDGTVCRHPLTIPEDWVIPTGGGYYFVPPIAMLRQLTPGQ